MDQGNFLMIKQTILAVILALSLLISGCIDVDGQLWVYDEGSGELVEYPIVTPVTLSYYLFYDGADYLAANISDFRSSDSLGAVEFWIFGLSAANYQTVFGSADTASNTRHFSIGIEQTTGFLYIQQQAADTTDYITGNVNLIDSNWHHIVVSSSGVAYSYFVDGIPKALIPSGGLNGGDWFADTPARDNITLGRLERAVTGNYAIAGIGKLRVYSRSIGVGEAMDNYTAGLTANATDATGLILDLPLLEGEGNPVDSIGGLTFINNGAEWVLIN